MQPNATPNIVQQLFHDWARNKICTHGCWLVKGCLLSTFSVRVEHRLQLRKKIPYTDMGPALHYWGHLCIWECQKVMASFCDLCGESPPVLAWCPLQGITSFGEKVEWPARMLHCKWLVHTTAAVKKPQRCSFHSSLSTGAPGAGAEVPASGTLPAHYLENRPFWEKWVKMCEMAWRGWGGGFGKMTPPPRF